MECRPRDRLAFHASGKAALKWAFGYSRRLVAQQSIVVGGACLLILRQVGRRVAERVITAPPGVVSHGRQRRFLPIVPSVPGCCIFHGNEGVQRPR